MSYITEVLIHGADERQIASLNDWLRESDVEGRQQFVRINMDAAGGAKYYTSKVWAAAFNYVPSALFAKLRDPETWGTRVLLIAIIIDDEEGTEAFCFDGSEREGFGPVMRQERLRA